MNTDAEALLKLAEWLGHEQARFVSSIACNDPAVKAHIATLKGWEDSVRQAASQGRAGGEAVDKADYKIGWWLSAALEDPAVCAEMKADINAWFEAHQPGLTLSPPVKTGG